MTQFRLLLLLVVTFFNGVLWSQEWRDSLNYARKCYKNGDYNEALKYYKSAERLAPNDVNLSEEKGQAAYRAQAYQEAEQAYQRAAASQTDKKRKASVYNNLGSARMKQQNYAGAENAFKEALRLNPENEKARQLLAEAKRLRRKQEQEQKNQNQQNENKDNPDQNTAAKPQQGNQPKPDKQSQQPQQGQGNPKPQNGSQQEQKLADKQTERKLDELMRQEMDTKRRLDGSKGRTNGTKAKKDW